MKPEELDVVLREIVLGHLNRLASYVPGPVKRAGGTPKSLIERYRADPLFSMFGLDTPEYVSATLGGGTVTSIHRKIGDLYEACVQTILSNSLDVSLKRLVYTAPIASGDRNADRTADAYIRFDWVSDKGRRGNLERFCGDRLNELTDDPRIELVGVGFEVRHCYQTGDSKRTQADEALARHFYVSGILPVMTLFCDQSNVGIVRRYRSVWVVTQGMQSYDLIRDVSGYDFHSFLDRNRDEFRRPVLDALRRLSA